MGEENQGGEYMFTLVAQPEQSISSGILSMYLHLTSVWSMKEVIHVWLPSSLGQDVFSIYNLVTVVCFQVSLAVPRVT